MLSTRAFTVCMGVKIGVKIAVNFYVKFDSEIVIFDTVKFNGVSAPDGRIIYILRA